MTRTFIIFVAAGLSAMPVYAQEIGTYTIGVGANVISMAETDDYTESNDNELPDLTGCQMVETVDSEGNVNRMVVC